MTLKEFIEKALEVGCSLDDTIDICFGFGKSSGVEEVEKKYEGLISVSLNDYPD